MATTTHDYLLIADFTGYTQYLSESESAFTQAAAESLHHGYDH